VATIDERRCHELYVALEDMIGTEQADTLMSMLPPTGWADVATKRDLGHTDDLLNVRIDGLRVQFNEKIDGVRAELTEKIDGLGHRLEARFEASLRSTTRMLFATFVGIMIAMTSALMTTLVLVS
jgi:hypothetical protein